MAVKSKEELLKTIQERTKDSTDDETLAFIADFTDTLDDLASKAADTTNWQQKYEDNDAEWRKRYKERFFSPKSEPEENLESAESEPEEKTRYEDLFTKKEG